MNSRLINFVSIMSLVVILYVCCIVYWRNGSLDPALVIDHLRLCGDRLSHPVDYLSSSRGIISIFSCFIACIVYTSPKYKNVAVQCFFLLCGWVRVYFKVAATTLNT